MQVITCLTTEHNLLIVGLAALFCAFGSWVTISLFLRVQNAASAIRHLWLVLAGVSAGATTWCTHFVAMLAYQPSVTVSYDIGRTAISLVVAILGATAGM